MSKSYKMVPAETTISGAVSEGFSELEALRDECSEVADNMENGNLGQTSRCQAMRDAADALDGIGGEPDVPDMIGGVAVTVHTQVNRRKDKGPSRVVRRDNAVAHLQAAKDACEEIMGEEDQKNSEGSERYEAASTLADELDTAISDAEGVEFPGMYG